MKAPEEVCSALLKEGGAAVEYVWSVDGVICIWVLFVGTSHLDSVVGPQKIDPP